MIRSVKNKTPRIYFDNVSKNYRPISKDGVVKVWLSTVFNKKTYAINLNTTLTFTKISNYEYDITGDVKGFHKIELIVTDKIKTKKVTSNSLLLIVL